MRVFLVDTEVALSLLPPSKQPLPHLRPSVVKLRNASAEFIHCYSESSLPVSFPSLRQFFLWTFIVAEITRPFLGINFLKHHSLVIDFGKNIIIDANTKVSASLTHDTTVSFITVPEVILF